MVDNKVDGNHWLHNRHITATSSDGRAHRSEIDKKRYAREILEQHATDDKGYLRGPVCAWLPIRQSFDVRRPDSLAIEVAQYRFEENADAYRQPRNPRHPFLLE
jgi:hypothetical protein